MLRDARHSSQNTSCICCHPGQWQKQVTLSQELVKREERVWYMTPALVTAPSSINKTLKPQCGLSADTHVGREKQLPHLLKLQDLCSRGSAQRTTLNSNQSLLTGLFPTASLPPASLRGKDRRNIKTRRMGRWQKGGDHSHAAGCFCTSFTV